MPAVSRMLWVRSVWARSDTGPLELRVSGQLLEADRWLATGTRPHFCADAALAPRESTG